MSGTSIARGTLLLTAANLAIRCVSMLFQIYLSARLGAAGLGLMQLISSVGMLAMTLGAAGVRVAAMYLTAEEFGRGRTGGVRSAVSWCMGYGLILSTAAGLLLLRLAPWLAERWIADARAVPSLRLLGLFLPVSCLTSILTGYFTACGKLRQMVLIELAERLASVLLTILFLRWAGDRVDLACCAIFAGSAVTCAASFLVMYGIYCADSRRFAPTPKGLHMGRRLLRLCGPLAVNEYLRSGLSTLENLLIPRGLRQYGASGERSMASYGIIHGMVFPVITFASAILFSLSDVLVPELARCRAAGRQARILHLTDRCLRLGLIYAAGVAGLLTCLAERLGLLLYQNGEAGRYILIFAPMVLVLYLDAVVDGMHKGLGQQLHCVRYNTLTSFLDVLFLFFLLPRWGIGGFVFSFTVTHLLNFWLSLRRLLLVTGYPVALSFAQKVPLLALLAVVPVRLLGRIGPETATAALLLGGLYLAFYVLLLTATGTCSAGDLSWLRTLRSAEKG